MQSQPDDAEIGDALRGLTIQPMPVGWTPIDLVCMVKCLNDEGRPLWVLRVTKGINEEELLGALNIHVALLERDMLDAWRDET